MKTCECVHAHASLCVYVHMCDCRGERRKDLFLWRGLPCFLYNVKVCNVYIKIKCMGGNVCKVVVRAVDC